MNDKTRRPTTTTTDIDALRKRARRLGLWGLIAHWNDVPEDNLIQRLIEWEEAERKQRSLERRIRISKIGRFKPITDFDWKWPKKLDRALIEELLTLDFIAEHANIFLMGPNGVGKTVIAKNLAHRALVAGHTVRFATASELLADLAAQETASARQRRLIRYVNPTLLVIDELGYLSYDNRFADLLYEVVSARHEERSTIITTNRPFSEWNDVFPNAACVVTLIDRLTQCAEIVEIVGESYRLREARTRADRKREERKRAPK